MRAFFTLVHRWIGLSIAAFLVLSGLTGAVISWDNELDHWLNPHLTRAKSEGPPLAAAELARRIEARDPRAVVTYMPFVGEPGFARSFYVEGRLDPSTGDHVPLGYNEVFVDPVSGEELGRREWGQAWPITRETVVSFLYKLHYTLHIPAMWGIEDWGVWLMGGVAILWTLDCFVGFYLTLPVRKAPRSRPAPVARQLAKGWWGRWKPSWKIKTSGGSYRITFDIHRAVSLWTWLLLFIIAFTGFSLNLHSEIFQPAMARLTTLSPSPFETRQRIPHAKQVAPSVSFARAAELGEAEAARRGWDLPAGAVRYMDSLAMYEVRLFRPGEERVAGLRNAMLYFDAQSGALVGNRQPWTGTVGDIFVQAQFPLHSGRILGIPGRIAVSVMGVLVAVLAITGVLIWQRKRRARWHRRQSQNALPAPAE